MKSEVLIPNFIFESELWLFSGAYDRRSALIDLMGMARIEDEKIIVDGEEIEFKKGSVLVVQTALVVRWKWSRKKVYTFLRRIESSGYIRLEKHRLFTVILFPHLANFSETKAETKESSAMSQLLDATFWEEH